MNTCLFRSFFGFSAAVVLFAWMGLSVQAAGDLDFDQEAKPFLSRYCTKCHNGEKTKGGVNLDVLKNEVSIYRFRDRVEDTISQLQKKEMPPEDAKQPEDEQRQRIANYLRWKLDHFDPEKFKNPGYLPSHRLTRTQYKNTIRDLIGVGMEVTENLPSDEATFGFDLIGDVQEVSSAHLEKYLEAANYILDRLFIPASQTWKLAAKDLEYVRQFGVSGDDEKVDFPKDAHDHEIIGEDHLIYHTGGVVLTHKFPTTGLYQFKTTVWGDRAEESKKGPGFKVKLDAPKVAEFGVPSSGPGKVEEPVVKFVVRSGQHDIKFEMEGMAVNTNATNHLRQFNRAAISTIEISGPMAENPERSKELVNRILTARPGGADEKKLSPEEAARTIYASFTTRAYRRPSTLEDLHVPLVLFERSQKRGDSFENSIKLGLKSILISPHFLFHIEKNQATGKAYRLGNFELANRISYFLWSSMPDTELFDCARHGTLAQPEVLQAQTLRMLKDPKSRSIAQNFAPQWLGLGSLFAVHRDGKFHENNLREREEMLEEVVDFFDYIVRENRPIMEIITADYTFVNKSMADHYGIPDVKGRDFQKVTLSGDLASRRGGILGMTAVHMTTSHPKETNPSGRGKWVLDILLGTPPPPPPPNVPILAKAEKSGSKSTLRERLSLHRTDPNCASCHAKIDPIGFCLENYDSVGQWRDEDSGKPIDVSSKLSNGRTLLGPADLKQYLATEKKALFVRNLSSRLLTYALRRGLDYYDEGTLQAIQAALEKENGRFDAMVLSIVQSYPFQFRQNQEIEPASP
ncbi:MAG: hypothetical protein JWN25_1437 [Verrucomicrobiales bacterium]|nr:hypothetical protein [Verrucomicrobiales bacterium]